MGCVRIAWDGSRWSRVIWKADPVHLEFFVFSADRKTTGRSYVHQSPGHRNPFLN